MAAVRTPQMRTRQCAGFVFMVNILELQSRKRENGYREAWQGYDSHHVVLRFQGESKLKGPVDSAERSRASTDFCRKSLWLADGLRQ